MKLPVQVAPVIREASTAAMANKEGIDASVDWSSILKTGLSVGSQLLPVIAGAL